MLSNEIIYQTIFDVYKKCNIKSFPIDCFKILDTYEIKHSPYSTKKCHFLSDDAFIMKRTIFYNDTMHERRIQFTIMHEFAHFILNIPDGEQENEDDADYFASCIIAPRILIHFLLQNKNADTIHDFFGLSYAASNNALMDYKRWLININLQTTQKPSEAELKIYDLFKPAKKPAKSTVREEEKMISSRPIPDDLPEDIKKCILRIRKRRRKTARQMKECEKRIKFLEENGHDFFAATENEWLYGGL